MATLSCQMLPSVLLMNYVQPHSDYALQVSTIANLTSSIAARNGKFSTRSAGDIYSSSNYLAIKRIALSGNIVIGATLACQNTGTFGLLREVSPLSSVPAEINNILARG